MSKFRYSKRSQPPGQSILSLSSPIEDISINGTTNKNGLQDDIKNLFTQCFPPPVQDELQHLIKSCYVFKNDIITNSNWCELLLSFTSSYNQVRLHHPSLLRNPISFEDSSAHDLTHQISDLFLVECTLGRAHCNPQPNYESKFSETIYCIHAPKRLCCPSHDKLFNSVIIILPLMGLFLTNSRKMGDLSISVLPLSWLRLAYKDGTPARGSYITLICKVVSCNFTGPRPRLIHAILFSDEEDRTPILPPSRLGDSLVDDIIDSRQAYCTLLQNATSNRYGCRKYVWSAFQHIIPPTCYIHDPAVDANSSCAFQINVHDSYGRPESQYSLKVCSFKDSDSLMDCLNSATHNFLLKQGKLGNTRHSIGDYGHMSGFGLMTSRTGSSLIEIPISPTREEPTSSISRLCSMFACAISNVFPTFWAGIHLLESNGSLFTPQYLGGKDGIASSIAISVDLMNAMYYNVNNGSIGVVLFSESIPNTMRNWYFVLPNIVLRIGNVSYNGLAIRLEHGTSILFDGQIIHHGTSIHHPCKRNVGNVLESEHTMGWFWSAKAQSLQN